MHSYDGDGINIHFQINAFHEYPSTIRRRIGKPNVSQGSGLKFNAPRGYRLGIPERGTELVKLQSQVRPDIIGCESGNAKIIAGSVGLTHSVSVSCRSRNAPASTIC